MIRGSDPPLTGYYSTVAVVVEEEVIAVLLRRNRDKPNCFIEKNVVQTNFGDDTAPSGAVPSRKTEVVSEKVVLVPVIVGREEEG